MGGPLSGLKVIELQGRGPGPFGAMVLADLGAEVIRVCRPADVALAQQGGTPTERLIRGTRRHELMARGRRSIAVDLKHPDGLETVLRLVEQADVLVEGYRPGVAERLGVGPDACAARNPRLIYGRITGWGQDGPYASMPGHDANYVALSGALDIIKRPGQPPYPPANLLGDFGGGAMLLVTGLLAALYERASSGLGQVVDAAMLDGVALLTTPFHGMRADGVWSDDPDDNVLSFGAPFYNVYATADGRYLTIGAGEPQFFAEVVRIIGADPALAGNQADPSTWPAGREQLARIFASKTLAEWCALLEGTDTCFAPVLTIDEAATHPHNVARRTFVEVDGVVQPNAAPRFGRTPASAGALPAQFGEHTVEVLREHGFPQSDIDGLLAGGAVCQLEPEETP